MIIEKYKDSAQFVVENSLIYPNQFVSTKKKQDKDFVKATMDYFTSVALSQYHRNKKRIPKNYDLYNGIFDFNDYIEEDYTKEFLNLLDEEPITDETSVRHLKHYPLVNGPIDTMIGELSARTNKERVIAIDELSQSEKFGRRQELLVAYAQQNIQAAYAAKGLGDSPELQTSLQDVQSKAKTYATRAEQWGNKTLKALKHNFNIKAKSEEGYRDYLISGREFHHLYPDNSRVGFGYSLVDPANAWFITNKNARSTKDCWAAGTCEILSISEILDRFKLTEEEIEYLYNQLKHPYYEQSQFFTSSVGRNSIEFNAKPLGYFDHLMYANGAMGDSSLQEAVDDETAFSPGFNVNQTFVVIMGYFKSKEKIGKFTYTDVDGYEQTIIITDDLDPNILKQGEVEWTWRNKWMWGYKIGTAIYNLEPLKHANSLPIIGTFRRLKNSTTKSLLDLMKSYQALFNVIMNKIWHDLDNSLGNVVVMDINMVPKAKDSEDPIETMLWEAKEKGIIFIDTSVENTGGQVNFNQLGSHDLSRNATINQNLQLALQIREMCWEMIGITRQRLGNTTSSETATAINTALAKSYSQTEPWFLEHEYIMREVTQTMLDIAQYTELQKPESTLNYLNSDLDNEFLKVTRDELLRDLFIFTTSSADDKNIVETMKQLSQPAMQNGAELSDIFDILYSDSERKVKDILDDIRDRKQQQFQQTQELEKQKLEQQQQQFQQGIEIQENVRRENNQREDMNKQLDRENAIQLQLLKGISDEGSFNPEVDLTKQLGEQTKLALDQSKHSFERSFKMKELELKKRELDLKDKDIDTKLQIAKENRTKYDRKK